MGRTAKALVYRKQLITIETELSGRVKTVDDFDALRKKYKDIAPELWDYLWAYYFVDRHNRLVYAYEGVGNNVENIIFTVASDLHPSAEEKFDIVEIIEEETGEILKTLHNVDLLGILEGIKGVMVKK